jgi:hypothetical protein
LQSTLERGGLELQDCLALFPRQGVVSAAGINLREALKDFQGGGQPSSFLRQQGGSLLVEHGAMFHGVHTGTHCGFNPFRALGMGHDSPAGAVRNLNRFGHLFLAQFLYEGMSQALKTYSKGAPFYNV